MERTQDQFRSTNVSSQLSMLKKHAKEITAGVFKNTTLVQGWLIVSSEAK